MNIFNKVTLQSMKKSRTRTIVTIIGVILSAAMITAVATFAVSLQNYMSTGQFRNTEAGMSVFWMFRLRSLRSGQVMIRF